MATTATIPTNPAIEWSPVIAGTLVAGSVSLVLVQFGNGIGFSYADLRAEETFNLGHMLGIGLWVLWTQIMACMAGGYVAGRTLSVWPNKKEDELRDGAHGLLTWALSTVATALVVGLVAGIGAIAAANGVESNAQPEVSDATARKIGVIIGFAIAAGSVLSAVAAYAAAVLGGDHRDALPDTSKISFRKATAKKK